MISQYRRHNSKINYLRKRRKDLNVELSHKTRRIIRADVHIAALSAFISLVALLATYESQRLDRYYREVAIRPRLVGTYSDDNNGLSIRNDGTGPAIISEIAIKGVIDEDTPYVTVPKLEDGQSRSVRDRIKFQRDVASALYRSFGKVGYFDPYRHVSFPNWSVSSVVPGSQRDLFKIDKKGMIMEIEGMSDILPKSSVNKVKQIIDNIMPIIFSRHALKLCYCSITSLYCKEQFNGPLEEGKEGDKCPELGEEYVSIYDYALNYIGLRQVKAVDR